MRFVEVPHLEGLNGNHPRHLGPFLLVFGHPQLWSPTLLTICTILIDFNSMSTCLGIFYTYRLWNCIYHTFTITFFVLFLNTFF